MSIICDQCSDPRRGTITESMEGKRDSELLEEMGVDTDEAVGVDYKTLEQLMPKRVRR